MIPYGQFFLGGGRRGKGQRGIISKRRRRRKNVSKISLFVLKIALRTIIKFFKTHTNKRVVHLKFHL